MAVYVRYIPTGLSSGGGGGTPLTVGALNGQPKSADGGVINTNVLYFQTADATYPGLVSVGTQSFSGDKTFLGNISAANLSGTNTGDVTLTAVGSSPNANGASLAGQVLTLQPADGSNPGLILSSAQTIGGSKTFTGVLNVPGTIDVPATGGTDVLSIGIANADVINLGNSGTTVNITGSLVYVDVSELQVTDPNITLNVGGGAGTAGGAGIDIEEAASVTAYAAVSSDRNSWDLKAPATAGVVTITPGPVGFVIDQGSHDSVTLGAFGSSPNANAASLSGQVLTLQPADGSNPGGVSTTTQTFAGNKTFSGTIAASNLSGTNTGDVTLGTANGLSLVGQALSLGLSSTSTTGALSDTDWDTFNNKQPAGNYITDLTGDATATGPGSAALTLATVNANVGSFGSSTSIPNFTVNGKGLITAAGSNAVIAPAGTLTGTTLAANVVSSSLTSVGTISSGTWQGTAVDATHGGTAQTSYTTGDTLYASASNTLSKLSVGSTGDVLTVAGGVPTWAAPTAAPSSNYFYGNMSSSSSWTTTSSAFPGILTNSGGNALSNTKSSGMTVTAGAFFVPGVTWIPSSASAVYMVNVSFGFYNATANSENVFRLFDGTNALGYYFVQTPTSAQFYGTLQGIYAPGTTSPVTLVLDAARTTGTLNIGAPGSISGGFELTFSIVQIQ